MRKEHAEQTAVQGCCTSSDPGLPVLNGLQDRRDRSLRSSVQGWPLLCPSAGRQSCSSETYGLGQGLETAGGKISHGPHMRCSRGRPRSLPKHGRLPQGASPWVAGQSQSVEGCRVPHPALRGGVKVETMSSLDDMNSQDDGTHPTGQAAPVCLGRSRWRMSSQTGFLVWTAGSVCPVLGKTGTDCLC